MRSRPAGRGHSARGGPPGAPAAVNSRLGRLRPPVALNYRGVAVGTWLGVALTGLIAATLLATAIALWAFGTHTASAPRLIWVALGCLGVGAAGLYDDLQPARTRGLLRQLRLLASGRVTSGVVKLVAICVIVAAVVWGLDVRGWRLVLAVPLVAGC